METNATENTFEKNINHKTAKRPKKTFNPNIIGKNSKRLYNGTVTPPWIKNGTKEKPR